MKEFSEPNRGCSTCGTFVPRDTDTCPGCHGSVGRGYYGGSRAPTQRQIEQRAAVLRRAHLELKRHAPKPKEKRVEMGGIRLFSARLLGRTLRVRYLGVA